MSRPRILKGIRELRIHRGLPAGERIRRPRRRAKPNWSPGPRMGARPGLHHGREYAGDPMSLPHWTNKSTARTAEESTRQRHPTSDETVRRRLWDGMLLSGQCTKPQEEGSGPGMDEQFRNPRRARLSIDAKKKERVGNFQSSGQTWRPKGEPLEVNSYDYPHLGGRSGDSLRGLRCASQRGLRMSGCRTRPRSLPWTVCTGGGSSFGGGTIPLPAISYCVPTVGSVTEPGTRPGNIICNKFADQMGLAVLSPRDQQVERD
jgi:hypothetical protein